MITGKVAGILSDEKVVLNVGSEDGVKKGMEFVIFIESDHIIDPETGDDLGAIEMVKGRVKVYHVQDKMSQARTLTYQVRRSSIYDWISDPLSGVETRRRKLQVHEDQVSPITEDLVVRIRDKVRSV